MAILIYLKKVKKFGPSGYTVMDVTTCPSGKTICVSGDGEVYCPWLGACSVFNKVTNTEFLMSCSEPLEE